MSKPVRRKHIDIGSHTGYSICIKTYTYKNNLYNTTVKSILRGHLSDKKRWHHKTGDFLKEVQVI